MTGRSPPRDPRLERLAAVASLVQRQAVAALAENRSREVALIAQIAELRSEGRGTAPTAYERAGAAACRDRWAADRIRALNAERAQLRAERDGLEKAAARAVARDAVIARLRAHRSRDGV